MPSPRTFNRLKTRTHALRSHLVFTQGRLRRHPLTQTHIATFQALVTELDGVEAQARALADAVDEAQVDIYVADDNLNELAAKVWKAGESISKEPNAPWRNLFFGNKTLSDFVRPILGSQYTVMQQWPEALEKSEHKVLSDLATEPGPLLAAAKEALEKRAAAEMARKLFREVGDRAKLFDKANAARKTLYGELSALPHKHAGLATSFSDKFFRRDAVEDEVAEEAEPTIESAKAEIQRLSQALDEQKDLLKKLEDKAKEDEGALLQRQADEARLKQVEQDEAAAKKEKEELLKKLAVK